MKSVLEPVEDQRAGASNGLAAVVGQDAVTAATKRDDMAPHHGQAAADLERALWHQHVLIERHAVQECRSADRHLYGRGAGIEVLQCAAFDGAAGDLDQSVWSGGRQIEAGTAVVEHTAQYCAACCSAVDGANVGGGERAAKIEGAARQIDDAAAVVPVAD